MDYVADNLIIGNKNVTNSELVQAGVTHVLRLCHESGKYERTGLHIMYHTTEDDGKLKGEEYWRFIMSYAQGVLEFPGRKLYVHCKQGINRGPAAVYAILRAQGYSKKDAWYMIRLARPKVGTKWYARQTFLPWYGKRSNRIKNYIKEIDEIIAQS